MRRLGLLMVVAGSMLLASCMHKSLTPHEYFNWSKTGESGLEQTVSGNGVSFRMKFQPVDLMIANEIKNGITEEQQYEERRSQLGNLAYFLLKIESGEQDLLMHKVQDEQEYVQRVNYYSLSFQQDIIAIAGADTIPCVLYQFENAYGITPYINISLAFPGDFMEANKDKPVQILVNDQVFGNGILKFDYPQETLHDLPELTIE
jgi:hypothetical protein